MKSISWQTLVLLVVVLVGLFACVLLGKVDALTASVAALTHLALALAPSLTPALLAKLFGGGTSTAANTLSPRRPS
jgi:hypothetical protein